MPNNFEPTPDMIRNAENCFVAMILAKAAPTPEAKNLLCLAEDVLIDSFEPFTGLDRSHLAGNQYRDHYVDLTLKLMAPFVGNAEDVLARFHVRPAA